MKTPLATEVDLGPGYIVLNRKRHSSRLFSAPGTGHGRPSQLLLSTCFKRCWELSLHVL